MPLSQTSSENPGAVHGLVAARLAAEDAERMKELNRLVKGLPPEPVEVEMPKGKRAAPWSCCGSKSFRHMKGCAKAVSPNPLKPAPVKELKPNRKETPRLVRVASSKLFDAAEATVDQLVETIDACRAELAGRQDQVERQLEAIRKAIGEAA